MTGNEPRPGRRRPLLACVLAMLAVALAAALRWLLDPVLGQEATFIFFIPAVVLAAAVAGLLPGLFATVLATGAGSCSSPLWGCRGAFLASARPAANSGFRLK